MIPYRLKFMMCNLFDHPWVVVKPGTPMARYARYYCPRCESTKA